MLCELVNWALGPHLFHPAIMAAIGSAITRLAGSGCRHRSSECWSSTCLVFRTLVPIFVASMAIPLRNYACDGHNLAHFIHSAGWWEFFSPNFVVKQSEEKVQNVYSALENCLQTAFRGWPKNNKWESEILLCFIQESQHKGYYTAGSSRMAVRCTCGTWSTTFQISLSAIPVQVYPFF